jgi:predicted dehydrogenase
MPRLRVGIIGCGGISGAHAEGYGKIPDQVELAACCDVLTDKATSLSVRSGGTAAVFADWKKMLADCPLDAVDICLPHHLHAPAILDAAKAGKHILCEKPLCRTLKEADAIARAVEKAGVTYMASHNQLFHPCVVAAREVLDSGALGKRFYLRTQDCGILGWDRQKMGWRADAKTQGGGELIDTGYHPSYTLLHLAGSPVRTVVSVTAKLRLDYMDGEDTAAVSVVFESGALGQIFTSWAMPRPAGTHQIHAVCRDGQLWGTGPDLWILKADQTEPEHRHFEPTNTIHAAVAHFVGCVQTGQQPKATLASAREVLELILKAQAPV